MLYYNTYNYNYNCNNCYNYSRVGVSRPAGGTAGRRDSILVPARAVFASPIFAVFPILAVFGFLAR